MIASISAVVAVVAGLITAVITLYSKVQRLSDGIATSSVLIGVMPGVSIPNLSVRSTTVTSYWAAIKAMAAGNDIVFLKLRNLSYGLRKCSAVFSSGSEPIDSKIVTINDDDDIQRFVAVIAERAERYKL